MTVKPQMDSQEFCVKTRSTFARVRLATTTEFAGMWRSIITRVFVNMVFLELIVRKRSTSVRRNRVEKEVHV